MLPSASLFGVFYLFSLFHQIRASIMRGNLKSYFDWGVWGWLTSFPALDILTPVQVDKLSSTQKRCTGAYRWDWEKQGSKVHFLWRGRLLLFLWGCPFFIWASILSIGKAPTGRRCYEHSRSCERIGAELDKGLRNNNAVPLAPGRGEEAACSAISFKILISVHRPICACLL